MQQETTHHVCSSLIKKKCSELLSLAVASYIHVTTACRRDLSRPKHVMHAVKGMLFQSLRSPVVPILNADIRTSAYPCGEGENKCLQKRNGSDSFMCSSCSRLQNLTKLPTSKLFSKQNRPHCKKLCLSHCCCFLSVFSTHTHLIT